MSGTLDLDGEPCTKSLSQGQSAWIGRQLLNQAALEPSTFECLELRSAVHKKTEISKEKRHISTPQVSPPLDEHCGGCRHDSRTRAHSWRLVSDPLEVCSTSCSDDAAGWRLYVGLCNTPLFEGRAVVTR